MPFEDEVLAALRELTEGVHRVEAALGMVRDDLAARIDRLREDVAVTTTIATETEGRVDSTREIVRVLLRKEQELRRRIERLEERDRGREARPAQP